MATKQQKAPGKSKKPAKTRAAAKAQVAKPRVAAKANGAVASRTMARKTANAKGQAVAAPKVVEIAATPLAVTPTDAPAAVAVNAKLADIARANMNAGLDLACGLASAKSPMEAMRLGLAYWYDNVGVFRAQAQELRQLSANLVTMANEPIRESIRRG